MTSNLASQTIAELANQPEKQRQAVEQELRHSFRPEFLNRLDEIIIFQPLTETEIAQIVELQLHNLQHELAEKTIKFDIDPEVITHLAKTGYDPVFGARPLKRLIQNQLIDQLASLIIEKKIDKDKTINAKLKQGKIVLE